MKLLWCVVFLFLLLLSPVARAESADDQYVGIYNVIQQADALAESGQWAPALAKYTGAESDLKRFQGIYPDWNLNIVTYRLKYLTGKIAMVSAKIPKPAPVREAPTNASPVVVRAVPPVEIPNPLTPVAPAVVVPSTPPPPSSSDILIGQLQEQLRQVNEANRQMNAANELLNAKLREALSARPAAVDPVEFGKAQDQVRELQKRNDVLLASLDQTKAKLAEAGSAASSDLRRELLDTQSKLAELKQDNAGLMVEKGKLETKVKELGVPDAVTTAMRAENEVLKKQVAELKSRKNATPYTDSGRKLAETEAQLAVLESDREILRLENAALNDRMKQISAGSPVIAPLDPATVEKIKRLEAERDGLQKRLDAAMVEIAANKPAKSGAAARADETSQQLAGLRARIDILEARPVPYTPEELALMSKPAETMLVAVAHRSGRKSPNELPAKATALLADAKRDVANNQLDKAEEKYFEILKMDGKNTATLSDLASIQVDLEHTAEAEKNITAALAIEPNNEYSLFVLGRVRFQQNKFDDAFEALSRAAQMNPDNAEIQNYLGITLSEKGLRVQAEAALRRAVQIDPGNASANANLAFVYITQQPPLVELARLHYEKALAAGHPHNPAIEKLLDPAKNAAPVNP